MGGVAGTVLDLGACDGSKLLTGSLTGGLLTGLEGVVSGSGKGAADGAGFVAGTEEGTTLATGADSDDNGSDCCEGAELAAGTEEGAELDRGGATVVTGSGEDGTEDDTGASLLSGSVEGPLAVGPGAEVDGLRDIAGSVVDVSDWVGTSVAGELAVVGGALVGSEGVEGSEDCRTGSSAPVEPVEVAGFVAESEEPAGLLGGVSGLNELSGEEGTSLLSPGEAVAVPSVLLGRDGEEVETRGASALAAGAAGESEGPIVGTFLEGSGTLDGSDDCLTGASLPVLVDNGETEATASFRPFSEGEESAPPLLLTDCVFVGPSGPLELVAGEEVVVALSAEGEGAGFESPPLDDGDCCPGVASRGICDGDESEFSPPSGELLGGD